MYTEILGDTRRSSKMFSKFIIIYIYIYINLSKFFVCSQSTWSRCLCHSYLIIMVMIAMPVPWLLGYMTAMPVPWLPGYMTAMPISWLRDCDTHVMTAMIRGYCWNVSAIWNMEGLPRQGRFVEAWHILYLDALLRLLNQPSVPSTFNRLWARNRGHSFSIIYLSLMNQLAHQPSVQGKSLGSWVAMPKSSGRATIHFATIEQQPL